MTSRSHADSDNMFPLRLKAEGFIKGQNPIDLALRDLEVPRDGGDSLWRNVTELGLHFVKGMDEVLLFGLKFF